MADITNVAERLRLVRSARRKFLRMWTIDRVMIDPLVDRVAEDLSQDGRVQTSASFRGAGPHGAVEDLDTPRTDKS